MHIIIVEKNCSGQKLLYRALRTEGYLVSVADTANQAASMLRAGRTNIVLLDIFRPLCSSGVEPGLVIRHLGADIPILLVTHGAHGEGETEFIPPGDPCGAAVLELPPIRQRQAEVNRILQLCGALRQSRSPSLPVPTFNWRLFSALMYLPTDAYLGGALTR